MITTAFTCTGPYAVLIMLGVKRVENRSAMPVPAKGRCTVGCSKSFCKEEFGEFVRWAARALPEDDFERIPAWGDVKDWPGKIVGACNYEARGRNDLQLEGDALRSRGTRDHAEADKNHPTISWDEGYAYWWDLSEIVSFDSPIPCWGNVGMWQMPQALAERVSAADAQARAVGTKIASVEDAARLFRSAIPIAGDREGFFVLPLDAGKHVLSAPVLVSLGCEDGTTAIDSGEVFRVALTAGATSIIVAHNHPSGNLAPSAADIAATRRLKEMSELLNIRLIDHLIVAQGESAAARNECVSLIGLEGK